MKASEIPRIPVEDAHRKVAFGQAMLVCGYESDEKFAANHLEGAISLSEFQERLPTINEDQEIIFYCA